VQIYEPGEDDPVSPPDDGSTADPGDDQPPDDQIGEPREDETIIDGGDAPDITITGGAGRPGKVYAMAWPCRSWPSASI
jgi:type I restriction enzyme R subunit